VTVTITTNFLGGVGRCGAWGLELPEPARRSAAMLKRHGGRVDDRSSATMEQWRFRATGH
jgi:hypothetical protein